MSGLSARLAAQHEARARSSTRPMIDPMAEWVELLAEHELPPTYKFILKDAGWC